LFVVDKFEHLHDDFSQIFCFVFCQQKELGPALDQARTDFAKLHLAATADGPAKQPIPEPIDDNLVGTK
jgi:hypothetical protein